MDGTEVELKLALPTTAVNRLKRLDVLKPLRQQRAHSHHLCSVYYDTPGHSLTQAGITVRLRDDGRGEGLIQTVKTAGSRVSGLFARREWECPVTGPAPDLAQPDLAQLAATGLEALAPGQLQAPLTPIFTTTVTRALTLLQGDGWQAEMALDVGEIRAGERTEAICELELELQRGAPIHLFRLARQIAERIPVRLLALSKSDRGYNLALGRHPAAVKARPVEMAGDLTIADAFRAIARNCLDHLLANEQALLSHGDGEAVHQMRVALRRLRSALKIFHPLVAGPQLSALKEDIRWLLDLLGPARDADVFLAQIINPVLDHHADHGGVQSLADYWRQECRQDLEAARLAVASPRFTILLLGLGEWTEAGDWCSDPALPGYRLQQAPVRPFAQKTLHRLARKLRHSADKKLIDMAPPALHRVRIRGKQLRYGSEFFTPLFTKPKGTARSYLAMLGDLQKLLGELNDIAVAGPRLAACHHLAGSAWAAGLVTGWHEARRPALLAEVDALWREFRKQEAFWQD